MPSPYGRLMGDNMPLLGDNQTESGSPVLPSIEKTRSWKRHARAVKMSFGVSKLSTPPCQPKSQDTEFAAPLISQSNSNYRYRYLPTCTEPWQVGLINCHFHWHLSSIEPSMITSTDSYEVIPHLFFRPSQFPVSVVTLGTTIRLVINQVSHISCISLCRHGRTF